MASSCLQLRHRVPRALALARLARLTSKRATARAPPASAKAPAPVLSPSLSPSIEDQYQRKTPVEHVLLRPGMYIGAVTRSTTEAWVFDSAARRMVRRAVAYVPGLLKLFDELLVNACDNKQRDSATSRLDVSVDAAAARLSVRNDGRGIPVVMHAKEGVFVPDLIFGQLLTGSNFAPTAAAAGGSASASASPAAAMTGGQHGYGAKLANIFSREFTVETADAGRRLLYRQTWRDNMGERGAPDVRPLPAGQRDYTLVAFTPDLQRFGGAVGDSIDAGTAALMRRRAMDAAGTLSGGSSPNGGSSQSAVEVVLDGSPLSYIRGFEDYCGLYMPLPSPALAAAMVAAGLSPVAKDAAEGARHTPPPSPAPAQAPAPAHSPAPDSGASEPAAYVTVMATSSGLSPDAAARSLSALSYLRLSRRLEIVVAPAGLRIGDGGEASASSAQWTAAALEPYNQAGAVASFVNCMHTPRHGSHVAVVTEALARQLAEHIARRVRALRRGDDAALLSAARLVLGPGCSAADVEVDASAVTPAIVRQHVRLFVNAKMEGPAFDSQSKELLVSAPDAVAQALLGGGGSGSGSGTASVAAVTAAPFELPDRWVRQVAEQAGGVAEAVLVSLLQRAGAELARSLRRAARGGSDARIRGIAKLEDANLAGQPRRAQECTLILTEGDSAKALAVAGLAVVGRDRYGVFPLKGKLLNVRDVPVKAALGNAEIESIVKIMGLQYGKVYDSAKSLRYDHLMIMADQDYDGSHIKGLLLNLLHHFWPSLLALPGFMREFVTPIVKARKGAQTLPFFTMPEYYAWRRGPAATADVAWAVKYYKGLGTSTSAEGREYFLALERHQIDFAMDVAAETGFNANDLIDMAFSKKRADDRKEWLRGFEPGTHVNHDVDQMLVSDFIHKELILFSIADNVRSIPSAVDGLKPSQRKVLFACFKRNLRADVKVAQLAGYVSEHASYHHGEAALAATIQGMAQTYVGSNNINLLVPSGQFGTRLMGGKDAASPRYTFTRLAPITRAIFHPDDDALLDYLDDDGQAIEPAYYLPVIPMALVNGAEGIGTGWSTSVPNYSPRELIAALRARIASDTAEWPTLTPWYRGFKGTITAKDEARTQFVSTGVATVSGGEGEVLTVSELPLGRWTQDYKQMLIAMATSDKGDKKKGELLVKDFAENHTDTRVHFTVTMTPSAAWLVTTVADDGASASLHKVFKLESTLSTANMHLFDKSGAIRRYVQPTDVLDDFFALRLDAYSRRKAHLIAHKCGEVEKLANKARFVLAVLDGSLRVSNRKKVELLAELSEAGYKGYDLREAGDVEGQAEPVAAAAAPASSGKAVAAGGAAAAVAAGAAPALTTLRGSQAGSAADSALLARRYQYLLSLPLWSLTAERVQELRSELAARESELAVLRATTPESLWLADLDAVEAALNDLDAADAAAEAASVAAMAKPVGGAKPRGKART